MRELAPSFPVPVSERAERAIAWLERQVGTRYQGWCIDDEGQFAVDILRPGTNEVERSTGETLEKALDKARARVNQRAAASVQLRRAAPARLVAVARRGEPAAFVIARVLEAVDP